MKAFRFAVLEAQCLLLQVIPDKEALQEVMCLMYPVTCIWDKLKTRLWTLFGMNC